MTGRQDDRQDDRQRILDEYMINFVSGHALLQEAYDLGTGEEHPPQALVFTPQDSYPIQI